MAALARVLSGATGIEIDVDTLRPVLIFCGAGLSILLTIHCFELSVGFFN